MHLRSRNGNPSLDVGAGRGGSSGGHGSWSLRRKQGLLLRQGLRAEQRTNPKACLRCCKHAVHMQVAANADTRLAGSLVFVFVRMLSRSAKDVSWN